MDYQIKAIARLARISLNEQDQKDLGEKLEKVLDSFRELEQVPTDDVEPLYYMSESMPLRADEPVDQLQNQDWLENSCDRLDSYMRIAKVVESGE